MTIFRRSPLLSLFLGVILAGVPAPLCAGPSPLALAEGSFLQDATVRGTVRAADSGAPILLASVRLEPTN